MKTAIELHQLAEVRHACATTPMRTALARATPQPLRQHPAPQRLVIDAEPVLARQVLGRQRRAETLVHPAAIFLATQYRIYRASIALFVTLSLLPWQSVPKLQADGRATTGHPSSMLVHQACPAAAI